MVTGKHMGLLHVQVADSVTRDCPHFGTVNGVHGTAQAYTPVNGAVATLDPAVTWTIEVPALDRPFVMNTEAELDLAHRDYRLGAFGPIPRLARVDSH